MKKKKVKALKKASQKAAQKDIKQTIASELKQIISKLGKTTKNLEKTITKAAGKLAKELKIDSISIVEPASNAVTKTEVKPVEKPASPKLAKPATPVARAVKTTSKG